MKKTLEKSGLEPTAPNRLADRKHCALSTQPNPHSGFGWVDKGQCFRSARRFGAVGSSFSRHLASRHLRQDPPPPIEAILVIFGCRALIFLFESSWKKWKMTPLLCACAVVITLETQKCRKRAPRSVEFNFFINCDRQKRFSQNERRRADLQNLASDFLIFA